MSGQSHVVPVRVPVRGQDYEVVCAPGSLASLGDRLRVLAPAARRIALVSDETVAPLHAAQVEARLRAAAFEVDLHLVPAGEASKSPSHLVALVEAFVQSGLGRRDLVVTLGGGVVSDLGGLAAASFMRGVDFVALPSTLLAQVDASVGGKVAVDLPSGKNLLGAFHFPRLVLVDTDLLRSLPVRELSAGMAEMLKHGALFSPEHFDAVAAAAPEILAYEGATTARLVAESVAFKAACVSRDPREGRDDAAGRVTLNLGHTVGHALESLSNFELLHGEAVGLGLIAAARVSRAVCGAPPELEEHMRSAVAAAALPTELDRWLERFGVGALITSMSRDKKRKGAGEISYVALEGLGRPRVLPLRPEEIVPLLRPDKGPS